MRYPTAWGLSPDYLIPFMLVYLVRKRRDLPFHRMFFMFGVFIFSCGTTHSNGNPDALAWYLQPGGLISRSLRPLPLSQPPSRWCRWSRKPCCPQLLAANPKLEKEVAERKRVEEALETERSFVSAIFNKVGIAIVVLDADGKVVRCNHACERISGLPAEDMTEKHATRTDISLTGEGAGIFLSIADDGTRLPEDFLCRGGLGPQIMNYRAWMIGGTLQMERGAEAGTAVNCRLRRRLSGSMKRP